MRRNPKSYVENSDSEDEIPLKKIALTQKAEKTQENPRKLSDNEDSSSESDIENYLQPVDQLDFNSDFFKGSKPLESEFAKIEEKIFSGVTRLSDTDSKSSAEGTNKNVKTPSSKKRKKKKKTDENTPAISGPSTSHSTAQSSFHELHEYNRKIEEAKQYVEKYKAKKLAEEQNEDVLNLLKAGEQKTGLEHTITPADLHSSDFESCDSEREDWEEIKTKDHKEKPQKNLVPKDNLQITLNMPDAIRKKKGVDLLAAMKRRLNRIRKENQVLVHKVHLLCWIAHGNFVNSSINDTSTLAMSLSLLPSEKCYPPDRTDLSYLEQIVKWFKNTVKNVEKPHPKNVSFLSLLQQQISKKEAYNKKMVVYIFIAILRSLGIQCRLVLSLQVEPLRPPASELHSLSAQDEAKPGKKKVSCTKNASTSKSKTHDVKIKQNSSEVSVSRDKKASQNNKDKVSTKNSDGASLGKTSERSSTDKSRREAATKTENRHNTLKKKEIVDEKSLVKIETKSGSKDSKDKKVNLKSLKNKRDNIQNADNTKFESSNERERSLKVNIEKQGSTNDKEKVDKSSISKTQHKDTLPLPRRSTRVKSTDSDRSDKSSKKESDKEDTVRKQTKRRKSTELESSKSPIIRKTRSTSSAPKVTKKNSSKGNVQQVDGPADSSCDEWEDIPQFDGPGSRKSSTSNKKPSLGKLKGSALEETSCIVKEHSKRFVNGNNSDSENEFEPSPRKALVKNNVASPPKTKVNLDKLRSKPLGMFSESPKKQMDVRGDIIDLIKGRIKEQKHVDRSRMVKKRKVAQDSDSDSDYAPEPIKKKHHDSGDEFVPKTKVKRRVQIPGKSVLSDSDGEGSKKRKGNDVWAEVFLEAEEKWISVDVIFGEVHCVEKLYSRATHPVSYVVAWNNNGSIKDVTKRYCLNFNTVTRKQRVDAKWWEETIKPFLGKKSARDKEEDDDLARQQLDQPLPKSITEYKNHPLYALKRHLLKFEAIYPPDAPTLGFVRGEAVYSRDCVYTCMSRDIWVKQARVVKPGQKPYKIVKARPKYDKLSNKVITDQMLEIFGPWQTEDYVPPTAENGVVPRNAFGNVELFKSCMLPKGTVHLKLPGLNKVAKRMNIDCASAIVGFDFHGGWSHPTYDGFVVCKEFEEVLVAAWDLEQDEIEKREQEKVDKRVYGNWKKLIRGLLIREKLKAKYDFGETSSQGGKEKKKVKGPRYCTKKRRMYSSSESD